MSLVNRYEIVCAVCDKLISRSRLSVMGLSEQGGVVCQVVQPIRHDSVQAHSHGRAKVIASLEDDIACSKECAEKLMARLSKKRVGEENVFVSMSGAAIKRLTGDIDTKTYVLESWDKVHRQLAEYGGVIPAQLGSYEASVSANTEKRFMPTTFDRPENLELRQLVEQPASFEQSRMLESGDEDELLDVDEQDAEDEAVIKESHPRSWIKSKTKGF